MQESNDSGVSRRDVLEQTGVAATALAGVGTAPAVAAMGERKTTITTLAQRDEVRGTERVSKRWLQQTKRATRVKEQLMNAHEDNEGVRSIGIVSADRTIGDLRAEAVSVTISDPVHAQSIPSSVDGVSVVTEVTGGQDGDGVESTDHKDDCASHDYCRINPESIYGGLSVTTIHQGGTIGCRVVYNGKYHMLTARHTFIDKQKNGYCEDDTDVSTWQRNGTTLGSAAADFRKHDAALLRLNDENEDAGYSNEMVNESGEVVGRVTESGLKYLNGNDSETVHKRARVSGAQSGQVKAIQLTNDDCLNNLPLIEGVVRSSTTQQDKDSGSVVYYKEPQSSSTDHLYVVHLATIGRSDTGWAAGSSANDMYNDQGIWFGGEPYSG